MPATAALPPAAPVELRGARREVVTVTRATLRGLGEAPDAAVLLDVSIYGCRLQVATPPAAGARLWLRLDGGWPVRATVVWADPDRIGCRFDEPIANAVMRRFTQAERRGTRRMTERTAHKFEGAETGARPSPGKRAASSLTGS